MHSLIELLPAPRIQDAIDILIVAYAIYRIALLIRGTRAAQMVLGLAIVGVAFVASQMLGLFTVNWLLNNFLGSLFVIVVVLFQADIRRALTRVGSGRLFGYRITAAGVADEVARAAAWCASHRFGALIVIERDVGLSEYVESGRHLDARVSAELLESIFTPGTPLHDGAAIIKGGHIIAAACVLPLSSSLRVGPSLGTRHRAAIGISEDSDALVIVVSEETGAISIALRGDLTDALPVSRLLEELHKAHI